MFWLEIFVAWNKKIPSDVWWGTLKFYFFNFWISSYVRNFSMIELNHREIQLRKIRNRISLIAHLSVTRFCKILPLWQSVKRLLTIFMYYFVIGKIYKTIWQFFIVVNGQQIWPNNLAIWLDWPRLFVTMHTVRRISLYFVCTAGANNIAFCPIRMHWILLKQFWCQFTQWDSNLRPVCTRTDSVANLQTFTSIQFPAVVWSALKPEIYFKPKRVQGERHL